MTMASQRVRWLHLSDFHVGKDNYAQRRMFERIIRHVTEKTESGITPDFVFITGDIADKGLPEEYNLFNFEFLDALQKVFVNGPAVRCYAVPGNHDVDRTRRQAFDQREMADPGKRYFDASDEGRNQRELLFPRFEAFVDNDCTAPQGLWVMSAAGHFALTEEIDGFRVRIIGINTAWLSKDDHDRERLTPGKSLVEHALARFDDCRLCIVLGHHPLDWVLPSERRMISALLGKASALYLHGHLHYVGRTHLLEWWDFLDRSVWSGFSSPRGRAMEEWPRLGRG